VGTRVGKKAKRISQELRAEKKRDFWKELWLSSNRKRKKKKKTGGKKEGKQSQQKNHHGGGFREKKRGKVWGGNSRKKFNKKFTMKKTREKKCADGQDVRPKRPFKGKKRPKGELLKK